jgi:hypothetical protein
MATNWSLIFTNILLKYWYKNLVLLYIVLYICVHLRFIFAQLYVCTLHLSSVSSSNWYRNGQLNLSYLRLLIQVIDAYTGLYFHWFCKFSSATEAHDDDGLPHTLEHLVFMGSEKYPYKVLHSSV